MMVCIVCAALVALRNHLLSPAFSLRFRYTDELFNHLGPNPKAFAFSNPGKGNRQGARSHDV
jgi:hypothetical protein